MKQGQEPLRLVPRGRAARRENLAAAVAVALLSAALFGLDAQRPPAGVLVALCLGAGALTYGVYALRYRLRGLRSVELSDEGLTVATRRATTALRWEELRRARHTYHGGEHWLLERTRGRPYSLSLDGFTQEECEAIGARIRQHLGARAG